MRTSSTRPAFRRDFTLADCDRRTTGRDAATPRRRYGGLVACPRQWLMRSPTSLREAGELDGAEAAGGGVLDLGDTDSAVTMATG